MTRLEVTRAGLVSYEAALALQADLVTARKAGAIPDRLILLQHPPVITLGVKVRQSREHVLATDEQLRAMGVELFERYPSHERGRYVACGGGPAISVLLAARALGASDARVLRYGHSGEISGDLSGVVGYMAAAIGTFN